MSFVYIYLGCVFFFVCSFNMGLAHFVGLAVGLVMFNILIPVLNTILFIVGFFSFYF